jgi:thioredoxin reductase (NADPH)
LPTVAGWHTRSALSDRNIQLARRFYDAWDGPDPARACAELLTEDFEWINPEYAVDAGVRHGHAGWRAAIDNLESTFEEFRHEPGEMLVADDRVLCITRFRARPRNGPWLDKFEPHVLTFRGNRIARLQWFNQAPEAYRAAGIAADTAGADQGIGPASIPPLPAADVAEQASTAAEEVSPKAARQPLIVVACQEPEITRSMLRDLRREFGTHGFDTVWAGSPDAAWELITAADRDGTDVAMALAEQAADDPAAIEFLRRVRDTHRDARTVLMTPHAAMGIAEQAVTHGVLDDFFIEPIASLEDQVFPVLTELLDDWRRWHKEADEGVQVLGHDRSPESHRLCDFLARNEVKYVFHDVESRTAKALLAHSPVSEAELPLVIMPDRGRVPRALLRQISHKLGLSTHPQRPGYDFVIVGGGPAGLAAAVYGASEGLDTLVIEAYAPGGQAGQSSRIENYLGFTGGIRGGDLAHRALKQANRFGAEIVRLNHAVAVELRGDRRLVRMRYGNDVECDCALLACGVQYRRLEAEGVEELVGRGIYYGAGPAEARECEGRHVFIVGGANSAGQAALHFAANGADVSLVIRSDSLDQGMSAYLVDRIEADGRIRVVAHTTVKAARGEMRLEELTLCDHAGGGERTVPAERLFVFIGALPNTDWLGGVVARDARGFLLSGRDLRRADVSWPLERDPLPLETSIPGVFAAGDVRHGSVKRVASAVGEGAMAVQLVNEYRAELAESQGEKGAEA